VITRRNILKGLLGTSLAGLFAGIYAGFVEPDLRMRVQRWALQPQGWPRGRALRLVIVADIHGGWPNMSLGRIKAAVDLANAQGGDIILLMGDYRATHRFQLDLVPITISAPVLAELTAPLGVFAILGNHDWWDALRQDRAAVAPILTQRALEAVGIPVLVNRAIKLDGFWLAGLDSQTALMKLEDHRKDWVGKSDLAGTLRQISDEDPVILLAHEPDIFAQVPSRVALTLSGHTHGGQIRFGPWVPKVPSQFGTRFVYGHIREDGRDLVVSGGLGCSGVPVRFGSPPEITVVDLS
jgi:predicted MPP superfamily phosphohydrolase